MACCVCRQFQHRLKSRFGFVSTIPVSLSNTWAADPDFTNPIWWKWLKCLWVDNQDISNPEVLLSVLNAAGFDGEALLAGTQDPAIKAQLFQNTQRAVEKDVCGVPSMLVNDQVLVWGQDRLGMVEAALDGWVPAGE